MLIELKITAENPAEYWNALRGLLPAPALPVAETAIVAANEAAVTATTAGSRKRKPTPEPETAKPVEPEQPAEETAAGDDDPELPLTDTVEENPEPLKLTNDLVKAFAVRHTNDRVAASSLASTGEKQTFGRTIFQDIMKQFGATKFSEIADDKLGDVHDRIVAERAKLGMAKLDIAELAASLAAK